MNSPEDYEKALDLLTPANNLFELEQMKRGCLERSRYQAKEVERAYIDVRRSKGW